MKIAGSILAGGQAKRLNGIPKGNIEINDKTIITNLLTAFAQAGITDVVISANNSEPYKQYDKTIVADAKTDSGPLAGISAALKHFQSYDVVLFLPCDLPFITENEILKLKIACMDSALPSSRKHGPSSDSSSLRKRGSRYITYAATTTQAHPLCVAISTNMTAAITEILDNGNKKTINVWQQLHAKSILFEDENKFYNINTQALLWIVTGSRRGAGKTTLAHNLLDVLPNSIYAKYGHGKFNPKKQKNFFNDLNNIHNFIKQHSYLKQNIIIEANALALANIGDIIVFIDAPPGKIKLRQDAEILKNKANIVISSDADPEHWYEILLQHKLPETILNTAIESFLQQKKFI